MIASARVRRNCTQLAPGRRGAGSIPALARISYTVEGADLDAQAGK
jgi:hypothetical protein